MISLTRDRYLRLCGAIAVAGALAALSAEIPTWNHAAWKAFARQPLSDATGSTRDRR